MEQCRQLLFRFVHQARQDGLRNLLIIHGKGRDDNAHANIIRSYLARWLTEFDDVQAFCVAQPRHGGNGACYVSLRKSAEAKQGNWERTSLAANWRLLCQRDILNSGGPGWREQVSFH